VAAAAAAAAAAGQNPQRRLAPLQAPKGFSDTIEPPPTSRPFRRVAWDGGNKSTGAEGRIPTTTTTTTISLFGNSRAAPPSPNSAPVWGGGSRSLGVSASCVLKSGRFTSLRSIERFGIILLLLTGEEHAFDSFVHPSMSEQQQQWPHGRSEKGSSTTPRRGPQICGARAARREQSCSRGPIELLSRARARTHTTRPW
jgi:hypothetical protein